MQPPSGEREKDVFQVGVAEDDVARAYSVVQAPQRRLGVRIEIVGVADLFMADVFLHGWGLVEARGLEDVAFEMLFDDLTRNVADSAIADARIIFALWLGISGCGEAERTAILVEEVLLFEPEPRTRIIKNGRTLVGGMRSSPSGIITSHITSAPFLRAGSG